MSEYAAIPLDLGYTHVQNSNNPHFKQAVQDIFGHYNIIFNLGRYSDRCYSLQIKHKDVLTAHYNRTSYDEQFIALVGDRVTLSFGKSILFGLCDISNQFTIYGIKT